MSLRGPLLAAGVLLAAAGAGWVLSALAGVLEAAVAVILLACAAGTVLVFRFINQSRAGFGVIVPRARPVKIYHPAELARPPLALPAARPVIPGTVVSEAVEARGAGTTTR